MQNLKVFIYLLNKVWVGNIDDDEEKSSKYPKLKMI